VVRGTLAKLTFGELPLEIGVLRACVAEQLLVFREIILERVDLVFLVSHLALYDVAFDAGAAAGGKRDRADQESAN
jgi:hypothetical protein